MVAEAFLIPSTLQFRSLQESLGIWPIEVMGTSPEESVERSPIYRWQNSQIPGHLLQRGKRDGEGCCLAICFIYLGVSKYTGDKLHVSHTV